jgi:hypothetical protein
MKDFLILLNYENLYYNIFSTFQKLEKIMINQKTINPFITKEGTFFKDVNEDLVEKFDKFLREGVFTQIISYVDYKTNSKICEEFYRFVNVFKNEEGQKLRESGIVKRFFRKDLEKSASFGEMLERISKKLYFLSLNSLYSFQLFMKEKIDCRYGRFSFSATKIKELLNRNLVFFFLKKLFDSYDEITPLPKREKILSILLENIVIEFSNVDIKLSEKELILAKKMIFNMDMKVLKGLEYFNFISSRLTPFSEVPKNENFRLKLESEYKIYEKKYFRSFWNFIEKLFERLKKESREEEVFEKIAKKLKYEDFETFLNWAESKMKESEKKQMGK